MPQQARVTAVDAIESFRASLILYLGKARPALEEVSSEVQRTRLWLQMDQRAHWENQIRRRTKAVEEAQAALQSARIANLRDSTAAELMAVRKTRQALAEAEAKLKLVKKWDRQFDSDVEPLARQLEKLHTILANRLPKAIVYLHQTVMTLDAYAGARRSDAIETAGPTDNGRADELAASPGAMAVPQSDAKEPGS